MTALVHTGETAAEIQHMYHLYLNHEAMTWKKYLVENNKNIRNYDKKIKHFNLGKTILTR